MPCKQPRAVLFSTTTTTVIMSNARYKTLLEAIATIEWSANDRGACTDATSWCAFTGRREDETLGWGWLDDLHPEDRTPTRALWDASTQMRQRYHARYRIRSETGAYRWFDVHGTPLLDAQGEVREWFGVCIDIQDHMAAEQQLRSVVDNMSEAFITIDRDWIITFQNREGARINRKAPEDVLGKHLFEEWPEIPHTPLEDNYRKALATNTTVRFEHRYYDPGNYDVWLDIQAVPTDDGGLGIFYLDISERKAAEQRLTESERRFRQLADHLHAAFLLTSPSSDLIFYVSPFIESLTGYTPDEIKASPSRLLQATHPDDRGHAARQVWVNPHGDAHSEYRMLNLQGHIRWVSHQRTTVPAVNNGDAATRVAHILTDITERRELEHMLRQAQRMESLGQLAGGIAHDFNNILTVIMGQSSLLGHRLNNELGRSGWRELREIEDAALKAARITKQILAFARNATGQPVALDINRVLTRSFGLLGGLLGEGVELVPLLDEHLPPICLDPAQLDQVLTNLVANAADAMGGQGTLTLATSQLTLGASQAQEKGVKPGPYVQLLVQDTGPGIPDDVLEHIFDPFFTTRMDAGGTGLGLATCFGIVTRAGGTITARNLDDRGAELYVLLPAIEGEASAHISNTSTPSVQGTETLLIVEDEPRLRRLLSEVLSTLGYAVYQATHGDEALQLLDVLPTLHLLITDMVMPGMSGRTLALKVLEQRPELPILTISGYRAGEERVPSNTPIELALLAKPFSPSDLAQRVRLILDHVHAQTSTIQPH